MGIHFLNVLSRIAFAPLITIIEGILGIGILGKTGSCSPGIVFVGLLLMGSSILLRYPKLQEDGAERIP
jgi:hypothetical protein